MKDKIYKAKELYEDRYVQGQLICLADDYTRKRTVYYIFPELPYIANNDEYLEIYGKGVRIDPETIEEVTE